MQSSNLSQSVWVKEQSIGLEYMSFLDLCVVFPLKKFTCVLS